MAMTPADLLFQEAIKEIDAWQKKTGMSDSRLSLHACANTKAIQRLRQHRGSPFAINQVLQYIRVFPDGPIRATDQDGRRTWKAGPTWKAGSAQYRRRKVD